MPELSYLTKIAAVFWKIERVVVGTIENAPGYISTSCKDGLVTLTLDTAQLPHGAAAGGPLSDLTEALAKRFGKAAARFEQPCQKWEMDLGIPPAYRMTLQIPDTHDSLVALSHAHREVVEQYCKTALQGNTDAQLDYLMRELGGVQGAKAFESITGATMDFSNRPHADHTRRITRQRTAHDAMRALVAAR